MNWLGPKKVVWEMATYNSVYLSSDHRKIIYTGDIVCDVDHLDPTFVEAVIRAFISEAKEGPCCQCNRNVLPKEKCWWCGTQN